MNQPARRPLAALFNRAPSNGTNPGHTSPDSRARDLSALLGQPLGPALDPHWHEPPDDPYSHLDPHRPARPEPPGHPEPAQPVPHTSVADLRRTLDRDLVRRLVAEASQALAERRRERDAQAADPDNTFVTTGFTAAELEDLGTKLVEDIVQRHIDDMINLGEQALSPHVQQALVLAICDALFRLGPVQPLVDEPDVENILITGGATTVMYGDGRSEQRDSIFETEEHAIDWVRRLASNAPGGGRPFSPANPALRLNLPGNIRLSAMGWTVTGGVSIALRKHLHKNITLDRLVEMQVLPVVLADMLRTAILAGCSTVVSGPMGVGKTTMVRALCAELPVSTRIGTAEMVRELYLHELPGRAPYVVAAEVITGGGERSEWSDQLKGRFDLHAILQEFVSQQLDRVIVGEVAGREILALFKAMQMAQGSLSTVHAYTCRGAINRLVTLALEEPGVDETFAIRQVAAHIQLIVQMNTHWTRAADGTMRAQRHVSEVAWVEPGEDSREAVTILFRQPTPTATPKWGSLHPTLRDRIAAYGFDIHRWPHFDLDELGEVI